jgi:hypothetical protein
MQSITTDIDQFSEWWIPMLINGVPDELIERADHA